MDNPLHINILTKLAQSKNMWPRRISIVSTCEFIRKGEFDFAYKIVQLLLRDNEDIIQKAFSWMLREIGKRDKNSEINFLVLCRTDILPKVMSYAIENFNFSEKALLRKS